MKTVNKFPTCLPFYEGLLHRQIQKLCFKVRNRRNCHHKHFYFYELNEYSHELCSFQLNFSNITQVEVN